MSSPSRKARLWLTGELRQLPGIIQIDAGPGEQGVGKVLDVFVTAEAETTIEAIYDLHIEAIRRFSGVYYVDVRVIAVGVNVPEELDELCLSSPYAESVFRAE